MRARFIKPGFFKSEELAELPALGRILFAGLWCMADKAGRLEDRPKRIKAEALPYDECDVEALLNQLATGKFIIRYEVAGARYIQVSNWKHQSPHHTEAASTIPPHEGSTCDNESSTLDAGGLTVTSPLDNESPPDNHGALLITSHVLPITSHVLPEIPAAIASDAAEPPGKFDFKRLWRLIEAQQDHLLTWSYPTETAAVKSILKAYPRAGPEELAAFLAYKRTCYGVDPASQPSFSKYKGDFAAWYVGGMPERQEAARNGRAQITGSANGPGHHVFKTAKQSATEEYLRDEMEHRASRQSGGNHSPDVPGG